MVIQIDIFKCDLCRDCEEVCQKDAMYQRIVPRRMEISKERCDECGACIVACKHKAITKEEQNCKKEYETPELAKGANLSGIKF